MQGLRLPVPMPLLRLDEPFDDLDWIFEITHDGFRAVAVTAAS